MDELITALAALPEACDPEASADVIAELAQPGAVYDVMVSLCRAVHLLEVEVADLRRSMP